MQPYWKNLIGKVVKFNKHVEECEISPAAKYFNNA